MDPAVDYSAVDSTTVVVVPYSCKNLFKVPTHTIQGVLATIGIAYILGS